MDWIEYNTKHHPMHIIFITNSTYQLSTRAMRELQKKKNEKKIKMKINKTSCTQGGKR